MIKNSLKDNTPEEFLSDINRIIKDKENFEENIQTIYKNFLGFDGKFLYMMPFEELKKLFIHPRINDYSKLSLMSILFILEWVENDKKTSDNFEKMIKGYKILRYIYLNEEENKIYFSNDYLYKACNELMSYEITLELKKSLIDVFMKDKNICKVDDLLFEIVEEDISLKGECIDIYNKVLLFEDEVFENNGLDREEIEESIKEINLL